MEIRTQTLALGLALALGTSGTGVVLAQGMPDSQPDQGSSMSNGMMGGGMMPCPMIGGAGMGMTQEILDPEQRDEMRELI